MLRPLLSFLALLSAASLAAADESPPLGHKRTAWESPLVHDHRSEVFQLADDYIGFVGRHKTEREVVAAAVELARKAGFRPASAVEPLKSAHAGDKLLFEEHGKILALVVLGKRPLSEGARLVGAHVDAVRIDLKQNPLYADANLALLRTQYYGNLKKYQWLSLPLELRGVVFRKDGRRVDLHIGADAKDPVLVIPDLLPQLSREVDREEGEQVLGENLDPIAGSMPAAGVRGDPFEATVARILADKYGVELDDLRAAELELVPAQPARSVGLDGALVGGYGQDDRACAWAAVRALLGLKGTPQHTAIVLLVDKEESGSTGNTGAQSNFLPRVVGALLAAAGDASELHVHDTLARSFALAADATSSAHPLYRSLWEKGNASFLGSGPSFTPAGSSAEMMTRLKALLEREKVTFQVAAFSKTLGTRVEGESILPDLTRLGVSGLTLSIPVMSMHAPFELISKADLYEAVRAYRAWLAD